MASPRVVWIKGNKGVDLNPILSDCSLTEGAGDVGTMTIRIEDTNLAAPALGDTLFVDGIYKGKIFKRVNNQKSLQLTAYDILQGFKGTKYYVFPTIDLGSRIKVMCADLAISYGFLAKTPAVQAELYTGKSYGDIIQSGADRLLVATGVKYIHRVENNRIALRALHTLQTNYLIKKSVMSGATYTTSAEDMKNVVEVYQKQTKKIDGKEQTVGYLKIVVGDRKNINKFGVLSMSEEDNDKLSEAALKTKANNLLYTNNVTKSDLEFTINKLITLRPYDIVSLETDDGIKAGFISKITKDFIGDKTDITLSVLGE